MNIKIQRPFSTLIASTLASVLLASISTIAFAQQDDSDQNADSDNDTLEEIVITGNRVGKALNKIPGAISIIDQAEIARDLSLTADVTALLARTVPGYGGSFQQLDRRGETLRGRVALRLLDGVPQGSPLRDGSRDSVFTDMGIVERIEVINGPSASEGIGASGGIINYITKAPTKMGTQVFVSSQFRSQFETDSQSWRVALNIAHKDKVFDYLIGTTLGETGIAYDGSRQTIAIGPSGSDRDSKTQNLFIKSGINFGEGRGQRLEVSHSRFRLECQCRYSINLASPEFGFHFNNKIPITSIKKSPPDSKASFNDFVLTTLKYTNDDLFGGSLSIQLYDAQQAMRFEAERSLSKQEPRFRPFNLDANGFPIGELFVEQSEIKAAKDGLRSSWSTDGLLGVPGLGVQVGVDAVTDKAQQRLAIANVTWVPPMRYTSVAPFGQISWDIASVTISGGVRHEDGRLKIQSFTSSFFNDRRFILGGNINIGEWLPNVGAVWQMTNEWSVYSSYSKGFTLPNVGIPLRNQRCSNDTREGGDPNDPINQPFGGTQPDGCPNDPQISVNDIVDITKPIIVNNKELGFGWHGGNHGSATVSLYESKSAFGSRLVADPVTMDFILSRSPTRIRGIEFSGAYDVLDSVSLTAIFSSITGKTNSSKTSPKLDRELGVFNVPPNKLNMTLDWRFSEKGNLTFGSTTSFKRNINVGRSGEEHILGFTLFNLSGNYRTEQGTISFGVSNLLGKTYLLPTSNVLFFQNYVHGRGREVTVNFSAKY